MQVYGVLQGHVLGPATFFNKYINNFGITCFKLFWYNEHIDKSTFWLYNSGKKLTLLDNDINITLV